MDKFLIVGLGNIGNEYAGTRHNIGFDVVDRLVSKHLGSFQSGRLADVAEIKLKGKKLFVLKPTTYMNLSGKAIKYWMEKEHVPIERVFVILDDLALPISKLRIRGAGSDGGHNGLKSIQEQIGSVQYPRLRFGIGSDYSKGRQVEFVLGKWDEKEMPIIKNKVDKCVESVESFVLQGLAATMNMFNNIEFS